MMAVMEQLRRVPMRQMAMMQLLDIMVQAADEGNLHRTNKLDIFEHDLDNPSPWLANSISSS